MPQHRLSQRAPQIAASKFGTAEATLIGRGALADAALTHSRLPPKAVHKLSDEEIDRRANAQSYAERATTYRRELIHLN